jgi:hypothetical protein
MIAMMYVREEQERGQPGVRNKHLKEQEDWSVQLPQHPGQWRHIFAYHIGNFQNHKRHSVKKTSTTQGERNI